MKSSTMETMSKSHMEGSTDHSVPQADITQLQSQESTSTSKEHKHDNLINGIRQQELYASISEAYERKFSDSTKIHENDNKQEIQPSGTAGHKHDNLINGIRAQELHAPMLEAYEQILGDLDKKHDKDKNKETKSLGTEGHEHRVDDFIQVQAQESTSKGYERSTDATPSWHNYSEQKLKDLNDAYPQNMKKGDRWSILSNEGTHKLDSAGHEQRLDAMAYKATDWFMHHAVSFEKDPQKAKPVADQIQNSFHTKDKASALLLLDATEMQKKYDQQSKFQKYRRVFAAKLLGNEMQAKKNELVKLFDVHSERFVRIQQKVAQLGRNSLYYKEHKTEIKRLRRDISQKEINEQKTAKITEEKIKQFEEFNEFYRHIEERVAAGDLSAEERNDLKLRLQTHTGKVLSTALTEINAEQKSSKEATVSSIERRQEGITKEQEKTIGGVLAEFGIYGEEAITTTAAFALSILAIKAASHSTVGA